MHRLFCTLVLLTSAVGSAHAQALRIGYYGETVVHYGFKVAYERSLAHRVNERSQARKALLFVPGLAAYRHPRNHYGAIASAELVCRRTGRRGGMVEVAVAPAYFRYFLDGPTYEPTGNGDFRRVPLAGGHAFLPTVSVGMGRDLSVRRHLPLLWYTRLNLMQQRPYNTSALLRFGLEAGVVISPKKRAS